MTQSTREALLAAMEAKADFDRHWSVKAEHKAVLLAAKVINLHGAALLAALGGGWLPIEEAPKDGTYVLLGTCRYDPPVQVGQWGTGHYNRSTRVFDRGWSLGPNVIEGHTHFMPLPAPPKDHPNGE